MRRSDIPLAVLDGRHAGELLAHPCPCRPGCTLGEHVWEFTAQLSPDADRLHPDVSIEKIAREGIEAANLAEIFGKELANDPEFQHALRSYQRASQTLALELNYLATLDRVIGDLPHLIEKDTTRPTGSFTDNAGTFVYIARDDNDQVLYVGITDDLFSRMSAHRRGSKWWNRMAKLTWEEWPDRRSALRKESILIRRYLPPYNKAGNPAAKENR